MIYTVKKSLSFKLFLWVVSLIIFGLSFGFPLFTRASYSLTYLLIGCLIFLPVTGLFIWMWYQTWYEVKNNTLIVFWGPFRWKIPISDIRRIRTGQDTIAGIIKPALSWKCIEIQYRKYGSISISPEKEKDFIDSLTRINSLIQVK